MDADPKAMEEETQALVHRAFALYKQRGLEDNTAAALALEAAAKGHVPVSAQELRPQQGQTPQNQQGRLEAVFDSWDSLAATFCRAQSPDGQVLVDFEAVGRFYDAFADQLERVTVLSGDLLFAKASNDKSILPNARALGLVILLNSPALDDPANYDVLLGIADALPDKEAEILVFRAALAAHTADSFAALVGRVQQFITIDLFEDPTELGNVHSMADLLGQLHLVNSTAHSVPAADFYNGALNQDDFDWKADYLAWKRDTGFSFCAAHGFMYGAAMKARLLRFENEVEQMRLFRSALMNTLMQGGGVLPFLYLRVRRGEHLVTDTLIQVQNAGAQGALKHPLKVQFSGESGVDEGGVQKELFQLLMRVLFDGNFGMFTRTESGVYWFRPSSLELHMEYELVGTLLGLAIFNSHTLALTFPLLVYGKLLGQVPTLEDLQQVHPEVHASFVQLLAMEPQAIAALDLRFEAEVPDDFGGAPTVVELCPDGPSVPVTADNREQYVQAYTHHLLVSSVSRQYDAFARGFRKLCNGAVMRLFSAEELEQVIVGTPELDFEGLERSAHYEDGFQQSSEVVRWFWQIAHSWDEAQKRRLLTFVTGSDRVPIEGLRALQPPFTISRNGSHSDRLPSAHTCFNHLLLPEYSSREHLHNRLLLAIENAEGFGLR